MNVTHTHSVYLAEQISFRRLT